MIALGTMSIIVRLTILKYEEMSSSGRVSLCRNTRSMRGVKRSWVRTDDLNLDILSL